MSEDTNELNFIRDEMKNNLSIRTTLLTFCFTSVITTIGFGLTHFDKIPFVIYLLPIIITVTFSCRITYYKDKQCKMNAYLKFFHKDSVKYETIYTEALKINDFCLANKFCSIIINNELFILSIVCSILYYYKFSETMKYENNKLLYIFCILLPALLGIIQLKILAKVTSYTKKTKYYYDRLYDEFEFRN